MRLIERELSNLTKAQVEALLECFDFLANGYEPQSCFEVDDLWIIQMRHKRTQKAMRMFIHPDSYRLQVNGKTRKKVTLASSPDRFRLMVNSDMSVGVVRIKEGGALPLVSG